MRVRRRATVGDVDRPDPYAATRCPQRPRFRRGAGRKARRSGESQCGVRDPDPAEQGDAVPASVPEGHRLVPEVADLGRRERVSRALRLLQADDVGIVVAQPVQHPGQAGDHRVDVPGHEAHPPHPRAPGWAHALRRPRRSLPDRRRDTGPLGQGGVVADVLRAADPDEVAVAVAYLAGELRQRRTGLGWASLRELPAPADVATLGVSEVDAAFARLAALSGTGSAGRSAACCWPTCSAGRPSPSRPCCAGWSPGSSVRERWRE